MGLKHAAIQRMKNTWKIPAKMKDLFESMAAAVSPVDNWFHFRKLLEQEKDLNYIPYIGLFLADLTFIKDGPGSKLKNGQVGWKKYAHMSSLLSRIGAIQTSLEVKITPDPALQHYFAEELYSLPENEIFAKSRELEPSAPRTRSRGTSKGGPSTSIINSEASHSEQSEAPKL